MKMMFQILLLICLSHSSFAFIEQSLNYRQKIKTSLGLILGNAVLQETEYEQSQINSAFGVFGEFNLRRTPWTLRLDYFSFERKTGNQGLFVNGKFQEFITWGMGTYEFNEFISLHGGVGAGALYNEYTMGVQGSSEDISGQTLMVGGIMVGPRVTLPIGILFDLQGRVIYSSIYPRGAVSSFNFEVGYQF